MLHRYWFNFELPDVKARLAIYGLGCGVTAYDYADAINLMKELVFKACEMPPIRTVVEDVDVSTLNPKHVRINMGVPIYRRVWFPMCPPPRDPWFGGERSSS
jgi:hypothetical protein